MKTIRLVASLAVLAVSLLVAQSQLGAEAAVGIFLALNLATYGWTQNFSRFGASVPRLDALVGSNEQNVDAWFGTDTITIDIPTTTLNVAGSPTDIATVNLPPNTGRFIVLCYTLEAITAAGTLAAATVSIRTAAAGAGALSVTATALTGVTAADLAVTTNMGLTGQVVNAATITQLFVRQTVDSANAGTVAGRILLQPVR